MRSASGAFKRALYNGRRDYQCKVEITLTDSTVVYGTQTTYDYDDGTETVTAVPYLTNENIMEGGLSLEDAVSNDDTFEIGAAIINQAIIVINNIGEEYTDIDFSLANVVVYVGLTDLDNGTDEYIKMGTYIVDEPEFNEGSITLTCLDYMCKFDIPYTPLSNYSTNSTTFADIIADCCTQCGIAAGASVATLTAKPFKYNIILYNTANKQPRSQLNVTCRQIVAWAAQLCGRYARCNSDGELCIGSYDTIFDFETLNFYTGNYTATTSDISVGNVPLDGGSFDSGTPSYSTGSTADGGSFNPWSTGYVADAGDLEDLDALPIHFISPGFSNKISVHDITITGVRVNNDIDWSLGTPNGIIRYEMYSIDPGLHQAIEVGDYARYEGNVYRCIERVDMSHYAPFDESHFESVSTVTYMYGTEGYVVEISGNGLLCNHSADMYASDMWGYFNAVNASPRFRIANISHVSDPTIEAGDIALYYDWKEKQYPILVSSTKFSLDGQQSTSSSASESANKSSNGSSSVVSGTSGGTGSAAVAWDKLINYINNGPFKSGTNTQCCTKIYNSCTIRQITCQRINKALLVQFDFSGFSLSTTFTWTQLFSISASYFGIENGVYPSSSLAFISGGGPFYTSPTAACECAESSDNSDIVVSVQVNAAASSKYLRGMLLIGLK